MTKGEKAIEKLRKNLLFFKERQDEIALVWYSGDAGVPALLIDYDVHVSGN